MTKKTTKTITRTGMVSGVDAEDARYGAAKVTLATCIFMDRLDEVSITEAVVRPSPHRIGWVPEGSTQYTYRVTLEGPRDAFKNVRSSR